MMKKDISYDLIRCLAMLLIIVWHFNTTSVDLNSNVTYFYDNTFSVNFGRVGVALFFILSGALLILHYDKSFSLKKFYTKRFLRIYIPQWLTYSIVFAIYYIIYPEWLKEHSLTGILISFMGG